MEARQRMALRLLAEAEDYLSVKEMAQRLGCSERTVRNDLNIISAFLEESYGLVLHRSPGRGLAIVGDELQRGCLLRDLLGQVRSPGAMELAVLVELLNHPEDLTVGRLADKLGLSRSSVSAALRRAELWLSESGPSIMRRPNVGLKLCGDERAHRLAQSRLHKLLGAFGDHRHPLLAERWLIHPGELSFLEARMREVLSQFDLPLLDEAVQGLAVYLAVAIKRVRSGCPIKISASEASMVNGTVELEAAGRVMSEVSKGLCVKMPGDEAAYLALHIRSSRTLGDVGARADLPASQEAIRMSRALVEEFARLLDSRLASDARLISDLSIHLSSSINRMRCGFPLSNPILGQIKRTFFYSFEVGLEAAIKCATDFGIQLSEDEVGYVVLQVQAAMERLRGLDGKERRLVIFCPHGTGMLRLMEAKISSAFPGLKVVGVGSVKRLLEEVSDPMSAIISTVPPPVRLQCPHLVVTPLLKELEIRRVEGLIRRKSQPDGHMCNYKCIGDLVREDLMLWNHPGGDRWGVIKAMAERLQVKGLVEPLYGETAERREGASSTCIGGGLAIPHGSPQFAVASSIAVARLSAPIDWGGEAVELVMMIAGPVGEVALMRRLFGELAALSEDDRTLRALKNAASPREFIGILREEVGP